MIYTINTNTVVESSTKATIFDALSLLPDNTQKMISPRDVRDAFLTAWTASPFKVTKTDDISTIEYIGLDSGDPQNRDIKKPILIGKSMVGNQHVLTSVVLNQTKGDIFFYNTKNDSNVNNNITKLVFLAGTNTTAYNTAPFISATQNSNNIDMTIETPNANSILNINGNIHINGVRFPNTAPNDGEILRYEGIFPYGTLKWVDHVPTTSILGQIGQDTFILGDNIYVNGYRLEVVDNRMVSNKIGDANTSFPLGGFNTTINPPIVSTPTIPNNINYPISEVLRMMLYPQKDSLFRFTINSSSDYIYTIINQDANIQLEVKATSFARELSENITDISFYFDGNTTAISTSGYDVNSHLSLISVIPPSSVYLPGTEVTFPHDTSIMLATIPSNTLSTLGEKELLGVLTQPSPHSNVSYSVKIRPVSPIYYGFSMSDILNVNLTSLNYMVHGYESNHTYTFNISGVGYLYFCFPVTSNGGLDYHFSSNPNDIDIYDDNNFNIINGFNRTTINIGGQDYVVYYIPYVTSYNNTIKIIFM